MLHPADTESHSRDQTFDSGPLCDIPSTPGLLRAQFAVLLRAPCRAPAHLGTLPESEHHRLLRRGEERRIAVRNRKPGRRRQNSGSRKLLLVPLGVLVVLVAAGVGAYAFYYHQRPVSATGAIGINAGDAAPDMPVYLTNGTSTSPNSFHGGAVLVWMVATWCPRCQETAPLIASQYYSLPPSLVLAFVGW